MISAATTSLTGPRTSVTSSRVSSSIGNVSSGRPAPTRRGGGVLTLCIVSRVVRQSHLLHRGCLGRWFGLARGAPFLETPHHNEERRHEQHGKAGRGDHAAKYGNADRLARIGAGAGCEHQWQHPQDKGERSHQDRAK